MPMEMCYIPEGETEEVEPTLVMPGQGIYFPNYSNGELEMLGLLCDHYDRFGKLLTFDDAEETLEEDAVDELPPTKEDIRIDSGSEYRRPAVNEYGERATMIIRHVSYSAIEFVKYTSLQ